MDATITEEGLKEKIPYGCTKKIQNFTRALIIAKCIELAELVRFDKIRCKMGQHE